MDRIGNINDRSIAQYLETPGFELKHLLGSAAGTVALQHLAKSLWRNIQQMRNRSAIANYHGIKQVHHFLATKKMDQRLWLTLNYLIPASLYSYCVTQGKNTDATVRLLSYGLIGLGIVSEWIRKSQLSRLITATANNPLSVPTHTPREHDED